MKQKFIPYIYILFLVLLFDRSYGQKKELKITTIDSISSIFIKDLAFQKIHVDNNSISRTLDSVKLKIEKMGFINYRLDSLVGEPPPATTKEEYNSIKNSTVYTAYFNLGIQISTIRVYYDSSQKNSVKLLASHKEFNSNYFEVKPKEITAEMQNIANLLEKQGNSFSEVTLKNVTVINDTLIKADLSIKKSTDRKIDKIIINGYTSFPKTYLKHHLGLEKNTKFNNEKLREFSKAINTLPFVSELKSPEVLFTKDSTIVYLYLKKENVNRFDGLIGFGTKETGKGISLNGYLDLTLNNLFDLGEHFNLLWKNNGSDRQVFTIDVSLPYIFNSKISPNVGLNIYKQDSSFVNTLFKLALPYSINKRNSIGLIFHSESSSNLLTTTNNSIEDYKSTFYGIIYNYSLPNNHPFFTSKFNLFAEVLTGKRKSKSKDNQTKFYLKTDFLWSLNLNNHIYFQNQSGLIDSEKLIDNELLRIGGTNSVRGFDEESFLASTYSIFNVEYRYNTNTNSYLYSISDLGFIKKQDQSSQLYAVGLGYAFSTKLGFINLSYALGKSPATPFNLNNSRFHLKIVNTF